jgi:5-methyltetrahydrofolate--homocysteine methyltransferase
MNPLHDEDMHAIMGANVLNGVDANCLTWIRKFREPVPAAAQAGDGSPAAPGNDVDTRRREREERRRRRG